MKQIPVFRKYYKEFLVIKKYWDKASEEEKADAVERCIKEFQLEISKNWSEDERRRGMRKLVCDICGKELDERDNYDEDGYSQYVTVELQNSRTYRGEYDICNECYEDLLKYAKEKGGKKNGKDSKI